MRARNDSRTRADIVVVDDDDATRAAVHDVLAAEGYGIRTASDGRRALWLIEDAHPTLLILDLMMPRMNGWELLAHLRARPPAHAMRILVFTAARKGVGDALQDVSCIRKPVDLEQLLTTVATLTREKPERGAAG